MRLVPKLPMKLETKGGVVDETSTISTFEDRPS